MIIPRDLANVQVTNRLAANQQRAVALKADVERLDRIITQQDDGAYDLDPRPGKVMLKGYCYIYDELKGSAQFDPATKKTQFIEGTSPMQVGPTKHLSLRSHGNQTTYHSSQLGYSENLVINEKTDIWNFSRSFLGVPLP